MTICITAICQHSDEEAVISVCDRMISMGGYVSADRLTRKIDPIKLTWSMMFAADDISSSTPIIAEVQQDKTVPETLKNVSSVTRTAYKNQRSRQIEDEILEPIGFSMDSFLSNGKAQLSDRSYEKVFEQVQSYDLGIEFLISGYDAGLSGGSAHIFTVNNPGKCRYYDKLGFWAIGSGQTQAIASLCATEYSKFNSVETCVAKVLVAKFMAESAVGVGKDSWLVISPKGLPEQAVFLEHALQEQVRMEYRSLPKFPKDILPAIRGEIDKQIREGRDKKEK